MIALYHASISTCSQKVRYCLAEKKLDWEDRRLDLIAGEQLQPEYLKLNPNGVVPTLVDDGKPILDSSVICEYLDEAYPDSGEKLIPEDLHTRAKMRAWLRFIEEVPTASIRFTSFNKLFVKVFSDYSDENFSEFTNKLPLRKHFYQKMGQDGFDEKEISASIERLCQTLDRIDQAVSEGGWLVGDKITLADICILPSIVRMEDLEMSNLWQDKLHFQDWYARMKQRDSYAITYYPGAHVSVED